MARFEKNSSSQGLFLAIQLDDQFEENSREKLLKKYIQEHIKTKEFEAAYNNDHSGRKVKNPQDVTAAILYGYMTGNRSSRKIEELLKTHIGFMYISNCLKIDHSILCEFKLKFSKEISKIFSGLLFILNEMGAIDWSLVAGDGTKIKAYASKGKNIGKERTQKILKTYRTMAEKIVERSISLDRDFTEDTIDRKVYEAEKARIQRQEKIYRNTIQKIQEFEADEQMNDRIQNKTVNMTDPESTLTPNSSKQGYIQGYNAVLTVSNNDIILGYEAITDAEKVHTKGMVERVENLKQNLGQQVKTRYLFDSGFQDMEKTLELVENGMDMYVDVKERDFNPETAKRKNFKISRSGNDIFMTCRNGRESRACFDKNNRRYTFCFGRPQCRGCQFVNDCYKKIKPSTKQKTVVFSELELGKRSQIDDYLNKLNSKEGQAIYAKRFGKEHVNANIKVQGGYRQTFYRGNDKVNMDLTWVVLAQNMKKYINHARI